MGETSIAVISIGFEPIEIELKIMIRKFLLREETRVSEFLKDILIDTADLRNEIFAQLVCSMERMYRFCITLAVTKRYAIFVFYDSELYPHWTHRFIGPTFIWGPPMTENRHKFISQEEKFYNQDVSGVIQTLYHIGKEREYGSKAQKNCQKGVVVPL